MTLTVSPAPGLGVRLASGCRLCDLVRVTGPAEDQYLVAPHVSVTED